MCTTPSSSFEPPKELFEDIADAYKRTNELFSPFFTGEHPNSDDDFTSLKTTLEALLELGRRDGEFVEVLGGLQPGTTYVTNNSYLVKADIEKSGASHDH